MLVVFDPNTIGSRHLRAPHQLSTGVGYVVLNGTLAIKEGGPRVSPVDGCEGAGMDGSRWRICVAPVSE